MVHCRLNLDLIKLQRIDASLCDAGLNYLRNCVEFWQIIRPDCGVKDWLEFSVRRSTNRLATGVLRKVLTILSDDDVLWLYDHRRNPPKASPSLYSDYSAGQN